MQRQNNNVHCLKFNKNDFIRLLIGIGSKSEPTTNISVPCQVLYLANYLESLKAKSLIIEDHYIDRHYIEEVGLYYSRCLTPHRNWCTRIHVFRQLITDENLSEYIQDAVENDVYEITRRLNEQYLGYIVVRPISAVPIGRTVLVHLLNESTRKFPTSRDYLVHLLGLELKVIGLAFQQQDGAVAACASTAIWTCLQRLCHKEGARAPTPAAITQAAVRHFLPEGRPFPSPGLTSEQISESFRSFDFPPAIFNVDESNNFLIILNTYVCSGAPVLLALEDENTFYGHAVTVVGYNEDPSMPPWPVFIHERLKIRIRNLAFNQIYIHDDRLGPYARARFVRKRKELYIEIDLPNGGKDKKRVLYASVPLYPKLRTSASELLSNAGYILPILKKILKCSENNLSVELFFDRSGSYLNSLYNLKVDKKRIIEFQRKIVLSRYIGVVRWYMDDDKLMDSVFDTTDTIRESSDSALTPLYLLGLIAYNSKFYNDIDALAEIFNVPSG